MAAAIATGLLGPEEKFGLHAIKHRAITDTKGNKADKQLASGHKSMQMVHHYDHSRPVVDPVRQLIFNTIFQQTQKDKGLPRGKPLF